MRCAAPAKVSAAFTSLNTAPQAGALRDTWGLTETLGICNESDDDDIIDIELC
jgi:hypothetical protein